MPADPTRLFQQLQNTGVQNKDTPMYLFLKALIDSVQGQYQIEINRVAPVIPPIPPDISNQPFLTHADAIIALPSSRELLAGDANEFDDSVPGDRIINVKVDGITMSINPSNELEALIPPPPTFDDYVVLSDGAIGAGSSESGAHVNLDTDLTISDVTPTIIDWESEVVDEDNYWDIANPSRLTIPSDGWYIIRGQVIALGTLVASNIFVEILQDGTTVLAQVNNFYTETQASAQVAVTKYLTAGQFVELRVTISSGDATKDLDSGDFASYFQILLPGAASIAPSPVNDGFGNFIYVPYSV